MEMNEFCSANREVFLNEASKIQRTGILSLLKHLESTDFYTAPASTRFHGSFAGGLCIHSLHVYYRLVQINEAFHFNFSAESMAIAALFHDICKVNCYKVEPAWRKDANNCWESYDRYVFKEDLCYGGHGSKSVYLLQSFLTLRPEEAIAVNCHMGFSDRSPGDYSLGAAYESCPLAWALHVADEAATYLDESEE